MSGTKGKPQPSLDYPVIAIGGSAGALEAFEELFAHLPEGMDGAFVVLQHLEASQKSMLPELIGRKSSLPIERTRRGQLLRPNRIYVMEPQRAIELEGCMLHSRRLETVVNRYRPIDHFFLSLAEHCGANGVGILLSGSGSDGTRGLQAIKAAGGATFAQDPTEAKYASMPKSAIDAGAVDAVLPARRMGEALARLIEGARHHQGERVSDDWEIRHARELDDICAVLLQRTGHDFSSYKKSTVARRMQRRLQARHVDRLNDYVTLLQHDPIEAQALLRDLLISVTQFFRDGSAFAALRTDVIPALFEQAAERKGIRAWVPACASGEEAYSLAILLREYQRHSGSVLPFQIFATDIDTRALGLARQGRYPEANVEQLPVALRERYFRSDAGHYQIVPELREACVFSEHSLLRDPPFSRVDLISCRNLFIYWESALQREVIPLFHYALNRDGYLFLGPAENVEALSELFGVVDKKHRIFQRRNVAPAVPYAFPLTSQRVKQNQPQVKPAMITSADKDLSQQIIASLLEGFAPPAVVINEQGEVAFYSGHPGRYLDPPTGAPSQSIFDLIREPLRPYLRALVHQAISAGSAATQRGLVYDNEGRPHGLNLTVRPLQTPVEQPVLLLVVFEEAAPGPGPDAERRADAAGNTHDTVVQQLEAELRRTREHLQSTIEQVRSSNEELLSMNEELQSANEELQTSKEELQSTNEELETVNTELSRKVDELDQAHSDLQNFFQNTQIPILFLDRELRIQKFTPSANRIFRLIDSDVGRVISDIVSHLDGADLVRDSREVLESLRPIEKELRTRDDASAYIMRVSPYRTVNNVINGVVVTFVDVTELKRAQEGQRRLAAIVESTNDAIVGRDLDGKITSWNLGAERLYWYGAKEALGYELSMIVPPDRRAELDALIARAQAGEAVSDFETEQLRKDGTRVTVGMTISPIRDETGGVAGYSIISRDITDKRRAEEIQARLAAIVESSEDAIVSKDLNTVVTSWNRGAERLLGYTAEEMIGQSILKIVPEDRAQDVLKILDTIKRGEQVGHFETVRVHKSGRLVNVSLTVSPIRDADGRIVGASKIARDITQQRAAERAQAHLAAIVDSADDAIVSKGLDSIIRSWNRGAERLFGYTAAEALGKPITILIPEDRQDEEPQIIERIIAGERVEHYETVRVTKDGRRIPISLTVSPIRDKEGTIIGASKVARDIGNRKAMEQALQRGLRLRDEFISIASHELKTPLTTLQLQTHIVKRGLERDDASVLTPERIRRLVEQTDKQSGRLTRLVDDMLEMSRLGLGKLALEREPMSLSELARDIVRNMEDHARGASCTLTEEIEPDVTGVWDRYRIEQVIVNLLTNACRYAPGKPITIKLASDGEAAVLEVRDQGIGIAREDQERIFERFERAAPSSLGGFGVGLYLLREIVRAHGGSVELESAPGKGATFRVRLPKDAGDA